MGIGLVLSTTATLYCIPEAVCCHFVLAKTTLVSIRKRIRALIEIRILFYYQKPYFFVKVGFIVLFLVHENFDGLLR